MTLACCAYDTASSILPPPPLPSNFSLSKASTSLLSIPTKWSTVPPISCSAVLVGVVNFGPLAERWLRLVERGPRPAEAGHTGPRVYFIGTIANSKLSNTGIALVALFLQPQVPTTPSLHARANFVVKHDWPMHTAGQPTHLLITVSSHSLGCDLILDCTQLIEQTNKMNASQEGNTNLQRYDAFMLGSWWPYQTTNTMLLPPPQKTHFRQVCNNTYCIQIQSKV